MVRVVQEMEEEAMNKAHRSAVTGAEFVAAEFGPRCAEFDSNCPCCDAWAALDRMQKRKWRGADHGPCVTTGTSSDSDLIHVRWDLSKLTPDEAVRGKRPRKPANVIQAKPKKKGRKR